MRLGQASQVLMASAGTGKTFQLSNRYLRLAQQGVEVERILASTFTRKAAGEILGAILGRLARGCASEKAFKVLSGQLELQDRWTREEALNLLSGLLRRMPTMLVSTLDSWFQRQVRAATLDLGLPLGWRLADEVEWRELHQEAVARALEGRPTEQMVALLAAMQGGKNGRSVLRQASELWEKAAQLWAACGEVPEAWALLEGIERPMASRWQAGIEAFRTMQLKRTRNDTLDKRWAKAHAKNLEALEAEDWHAAFADGLLKNAAQGRFEFYREAFDPQRVKVLVDCHHRLLLHELHRSNLAFREMASVYAETFRELQQAHRLLYHDDFPRLLGAADDALRDLVDARTGPPADHLLLDEFQDTSVGQWHALERPVRKALAAQQQGEGSVFVVGDLKQSIYGFREGEPRLLAGIGTWFDLPTEAMATNYRSRQALLDAVNLVFTDLKARFDATESKVLDLALTAWDGFPKHEAYHSGEATFRVIEAQEETDLGVGRNEALLQTVVARAVSLHALHPQDSLAILVRNNREIPVLLAHLSAAGVRASMSGGNYLTDARSVDVALSLLHLTDHPGDTAAYFHVATSPMAGLLDLDFGKGEKIRAEASALSRRIRRRLLEDGIAEVLGAWLQAIRADALYDPWNLARFEQLVELAEGWSEQTGLRASRFVAMVRETKVPDADVTKVQVMTVHQSKGLDFDRVLLPLKPDRRIRPEFITFRPDPRGPLTAVSRYPNGPQREAARALDRTAFLEAHVASEACDLNEDLCVLYVGMTRAKRHMELILPTAPRSRSHDPDWIRLTELLRASLLQEDSPVELEVTPTMLPRGGTYAVLWQTQALESRFEDMPDPTAELSEEETLEDKLAFGVKLSLEVPLLAPAPGARSLPRWTPSGAADESGITRASDLFASADDTARRRGTAIHRLFEEVGFLDDYQPDRSALIEALAALVPPPTEEEAQAWCTEFLESLEREVVRAALTRPTEGEATYRLHRERPFSVATVDPHGQSAILQGIFDRVLLREQDGQIVGAEVLDFKTGPAPTDGSLSPGYRAQLEAYRRALSVQHGIGESAVTCRLLFVDDGVSVALAG